MNDYLSMMTKVLGPTDLAVYMSTYSCSSTVNAAMPMPSVFAEVIAGRLEKGVITFFALWYRAEIGFNSNSQLRE
jgi:hypothetical protein